ncbi:MAG: hypothetical protein ACHQNE_08965 [Candidatus Kapaibacterium sp.]
MQTININPSSGIGDRELMALLGHATYPREQLDEEKQALPGSIEFHYRNHPNLLRVTRLRANRHGVANQYGEWIFKELEKHPE